MLLNKQCKDLLQDFPGVEIMNGPRCTNRVADRMAKTCRSDVIASFDLEYFEQPPVFVMDVSLEDKPT